VLWFKQKFPKVPVIANYHHLIKTPLFDWLNRRHIHLWDAVTVDSQFSKQQFLDAYPSLNANKVLVIYAGMPVSQTRKYKNSDLKKIPNTWKQKNKMLIIGGLKQRKNPLFALRLLNELPDDFVLIVAGSGPLMPQIAAYVQSHDLGSRVLLYGYVPEEEKPALYDWADLVILPSKMEGFGMMAVEAQSVGTPVVVSDQGSFPEVVDDTDSGLVLPLEISTWKQKITYLFQNQYQLKQMSKRGPAFVKKFSWDKSAKQFIQLAESLL
jgi:starch synthase